MSVITNIPFIYQSVYFYPNLIITICYIIYNLFINFQNASSFCKITYLSKLVPVNNLRNYNRNSFVQTNRFN